MLLAEKIKNLLTPGVGSLMAAGIVKSQCQNLGIDESGIKPKDLNLLSERIQIGIKIFVGTEMAYKIAEDIKWLTED